MQYSRLNKKPANARIAKNVPAKGIHGYLPALPRELSYWEASRQSALDLADTVSYDLADNFVDEFTTLILHTPIWKKYGAAEKGLDRHHPYWRNWNNARCDRLGMIALSLLCRDFFPLESQQQMLDFRALPEGERTAHLFPEPSARNERNDVLDTRVHMPSDFFDAVFEDSYDPEVDGPVAWYEGSDGLYVRRQAIAKPTTSYSLQLMELNVQVDFDSLQTAFPYLPSIR